MEKVVNTTYFSTTGRSTEGALMVASSKALWQSARWVSIEHLTGGMKALFTCIALILMSFSAFGDQAADSAKVYFRVGESDLESSFAGNGRVLEAFEVNLRKAVDAGILDSIVVKAYTSPDGVSASNMILSQRRCRTITDYLTQTLGVDSTLIRSYPQGIAWDELREIVEMNPDVPKRTEVLNILTNVPLWVYGDGGKIVDGRKKRLMDLAAGEPYRWLQKHIFPELRKGVAVALYTGADHLVIPPYKSVENQDVTCAVDTLPPLSAPVEEFASDSVTVEDVEVIAELTDSISPKVKTPFLMALKTNMLFDAALVPNLGAEFYLGRNISLGAQWMYAWWDKDTRHYYWRIYGGDLNLRWWFGRKAKSRPLCGHHLGVYGGIVTFDFELGDYGYMGGKPKGTLWDRCMVNAGIEYGFSLPVSKRLNIDFTIGLGYLGGKYIKYYPFDNDYYVDKEYRMRYFGPTKAEISLVWLIGKGLTKPTKGGEL